MKPLKRNVGHVKRFTDPEPGTSQSKQELAQPPEETPVMEPVVFTNPKPVVSPAERPATEPADDPAVDPGFPQPVVNRIPEQTTEPRRSSRKTMSPERLSQTDLLRTV